MNKKIHFDWKIVEQILQGENTIDFSQMFSKYLPILTTSYSATTYLKNHNVLEKIKRYEENKEESLHKELQSLFYKTLFLAIPNSIMKDSQHKDGLIEKVWQAKKETLSEFLSYYHEFHELASSGYEIEKFETSTDEVQIRTIHSVPGREFQKYLDRASKETQNEIFLEVFDRSPMIVLEYFFPVEIYLKNKGIVKKAMMAKWQENLKLVSEKGYEDTLKWCSDQIFKRLPDEMKEEVLENVTKLELEFIQEKKLNWKQIEKNLSGEELLGILNELHFEQEEEEVFHLEFDSVKMDIQKLINVSKRYKLCCSLTIESCADLSLSVIQYLNEICGIEIDTIRFKAEGLDEEQQFPYDLETYQKCKSVLEAVTKDILEDFNGKQEDPNKEKKMASRLIKRIAKLVRYNYDYLDRSKRKKTTKEEDRINRNLEGALLNGEGVCAAIAEAGRNVFLCCGLEARYISAANKDPKKAGHAWIQAKLDGEWMNFDFTFDADRILMGELPKYCFKSDQDFGHKQWIPRIFTQKCKKSVEPDLLLTCMNFQAIERSSNFTTFLQANVRKSSIHDSHFSNEEKETIIRNFDEKKDR